MGSERPWRLARTASHRLAQAVWRHQTQHDDNHARTRAHRRHNQTTRCVACCRVATTNPTRTSTNRPKRAKGAQSMLLSAIIFDNTICLVVWPIVFTVRNR